MKTILVLLFLSISVFLSCKKENKLEAMANCTDLCNEFDMAECYVESYASKIPSYRSATFNPVNPAEIIYYKRDSAGMSLIKFNLETRETEVLILNFHYNFTSPPSWGRTGWITFSSSNWKIFRVKDNGTNLKQISFKPDDQFPEFNYNGDKIIYSQNMDYTVNQLRNYPEINLHRNNQIVDIFGNTIDSICQQIEHFNCQQWSFSRWGHNNKILYRLKGNNMTGVGLFDFKTFSRRVIWLEELTKLRQIVDIRWHPSGISFFYSSFLTGIYKYDFITGQHTKIKNACNTKRYGNFSISPDGTKIIAERHDIEFEKKEYFCHGNTRISLVIMDIDGCNESIIDLP